MARIILSESAHQDAMNLTEAQSNLALKAVKRIFAGNGNLENIEELRELPGCYRWKPSDELRYCNYENEIRVIFRWSESGDLVVMSARTRETVYDKSNINSQKATR